jgi:RNA polymerase sigma factor (sigma-70 family)
VEASALQAPAGLARSRISIGAPLLRLRTDEQLVALFRSGHEEAFRVIHDRYRERLFAYARQMLSGSRQDAEDALQDVFVRAYSGLRANDRQLALRAWLYRVAHNRCIDELRRPAPPAPEVLDFVCAPAHDPIAEAERRESLQRLVQDVRRLPDQQRSALLMRELSGMTYLELAGALGVSVPAVKSLLVRARVSLAQSLEARETACSEIREELIDAHDRRVRPNATARRHLRDCAPCREFRREIRGVSHQFAALGPALGPAGVLANLLGWGSGAGSSSAAAGGAAAVGGSSAAAGGLLATGAGHVATVLAAAAVTVGGAVEIQPSIAPPGRHHAARHATQVARSSAVSSPLSPTGPPAAAAPSSPAPSAAAGTTGVTPAASALPGRAPAQASGSAVSGGSSVDSGSGSPSGNFIDAQTGLGPMTGAAGISSGSATSATPPPGASSPAPPAGTSSPPPTTAAAPAGSHVTPAGGSAVGGPGAARAGGSGISSAESSTAAPVTTTTGGTPRGSGAPPTSSPTAEPASGSPSTSRGRSSVTSRS